MREHTERRGEREGATGEQVVGIVASAGAKQRRLSQLAVTCCHRFGVSIYIYIYVCVCVCVRCEVWV